MSESLTMMRSMAQIASAFFTSARTVRRPSRLCITETDVLPRCWRSFSRALASGATILISATRIRFSEDPFSRTATAYRDISYMVGWGATTARSAGRSTPA